MTVPARLPGMEGAAMSTTLKVTVQRQGNRKHRLLFNRDINDTYEWGDVGENGEREFDTDYPRVSDAMYYLFEGTRIAYGTRVSMRAIEFTRPEGSFLDEVITGLLELLTECIGPRTFLVYMPR